MTLYDAFSWTGGRPPGVPHHRHLSRNQILRAMPSLKRDAFVGGLTYWDAQVDDARFVASLARTASFYGAHVASRVRVEGFLKVGERVVGVHAHDLQTGERFDIRARQVVNATGVWTDDTQAMVGERGQFKVRASKGIHLVVPRDRFQSKIGLLLRTEKSVLFVIPWQGGWLIGDTDTPWRHGPDEVVATGADVDYLLAKANALLAEPLSRADVHGVTAGLRPLVAGATGVDTTRISRRHRVESPLPWLTTVAGGKYTTYRVMAADTVDAVMRALGRRGGSVTHDVPLLGRDGGDEIVFACTHEGARHLEDVLERRTRTALTAPDRGLAAAEPAAERMAGVLGWGAQRTRAEVETYRARVAAAHAAEAERADGAALAAHRRVLVPA
jgi:glycerol-3-phosphate dehydrogenase